MTSPTPLQQLINPARDLDHAAIAGASDDLLRLAVLQSVDALQRLTDLADMVGLLDEEWGSPATNTSKFDEMLAERQPTAPIDGGLPDNGCSLSIRPGSAILVADANREDLVASLVNLHTNLRRYEEVAVMLVGSATAACRGEYVQGEFDKADHRAAQVETPEPPRSNAPRP